MPFSALFPESSEQFAQTVYSAPSVSVGIIFSCLLTPVISISTQLVIPPPFPVNIDNFDFAIYVKTFNSITNVARLTKTDFAMVFTSGISPYVNSKNSGPTEKFIHNYGERVHHVAFKTENIEDTIIELRKEGVKFLIDLVGSRKQGLKQTFTVGSSNTLLVSEYIHRYGDFDGFFTKNNVTLLTAATEKQ